MSDHDNSTNQGPESPTQPVLDEQHDRGSQPAADEQSPRLPFPVVGIGASAGGLEAFIEFFQAMPPDAGMAYVLVQHLSPDRESLIAGILAKNTAMPVQQVENGVGVEPNHVYVIRPGHTLTIEHGHLHLGKSVAEPRHSRPVDDFFRSLAEEQQERAICILMSGMGSNGTAGAGDVKTVGGVVIAQDPESAKFPSMPQHAIDSGNADFILRPQDMPDALLRYAAHAYVSGAASDTSAALAHHARQAMGEILSLLRARTRRDFSGYKKATVLRRIQRRMGLNQIETLDSYATFLRKNVGEAPALSDDLLIHVTGFFRDAEAWEALQQQVIVPLVAERENDAEIRCWVTACSTGEEAYTLSILLWEAAEAAHKSLDIKIFATDTADRSLAKARTGVFPGGIESEISPERLERFFERDDAVYRVKKELRDMVVFAPQNVTQDPPFSRLDICTCRNLLIYLEPDLQRRVLSLLHFGIRDGGALFLGTSESVHGVDELFETIDKRARLYRRVGPTQHGAVQFSFPRRARGEVGEGSAPREAHRPTAAQLTERALLERHTPAAVTVDREFRIVYYHGDTTAFLTQPSGEPTRDVLHVAREHLRGAVRAALHQAVAENRPVRQHAGVMETDAGRVRIEVSVEPLDPGAAGSLYLISFSELREGPAAPAMGGESHAGDPAELQIELSQARDELQRTVEELQSTHEEMRAAREEAMSINEELQSTNEELETSKEEMQSLNEELTTLNAQLQLKMDEHERVSNDLNSLLTSTNIAVIFLDTRFNIRRFTPSAVDLVELIASDVGRPLSNFHKKFEDDALMDDCQAVLDKLAPVEREVVSTDSGRVYMRRIQPYRTLDNRIDGVVITFIDVSAINRAESARRHSEDRFRQVLQGAPDFAMLLMDVDARIVTWNVGAERLMGYSAAEAIGTNSAMIYPPPNAESTQRREMEKAARDGRAIDETWHVRKDDSKFWGSGVLTALRDDDGTVNGYVKVLRDETARKSAEAERDRLLTSERAARREAENASYVKDQFLARLSHELRTPLSSITTWAEMLQHGELNAETSREGLRVIQRSAAAQAQLLNDLLEVSRIASGKMRLEKTVAKVADLVRQAVEAMIPTAQQRGVELVLDVVKDSCEIYADHDRLRQVVMNLLTNAIKFTRSGGKVEVRLERLDGSVELTVADTGQGIQPDFLPYIFTPFSQADHTMTRSYGGLGLGLSISKELVELHGGTIEAHSAGAGKGATFAVRLPVLASDGAHAAAIENGEATEPHDDAIRDRRILLVEDDHSTLHALSRMLEKFGAVLTAVGTPEEAYQAFIKSPPEVYLSDIGLPKEDGYQLLKRIRAWEAERGMPSTPAVALTAFAGENHRSRALSAGFQEHIAKPAKLATLITTIARLAPARQSQ